MENLECCDNGIIVCTGCNGEKQSELGKCAGCNGSGVRTCGKCGGTDITNKLPNIYTILDKMDFDKEVKDIIQRVIRLHKCGLDGEQLDYNNKQVVFSLIQKFYEEVINHLKDE